MLLKLSNYLQELFEQSTGISKVYDFIECLCGEEE